MPVIAVYDLVWNEGINTLVAGTFARSILSYSLEDIVEPPINTISSVSGPFSEESPLLVFPNPVQDQLSFTFTNPTPNEPVQVHLYSVSGETMLAFKIRTGTEAFIQKDISSLPAGVYFVKIIGERFYWTEPFVKG